MDERQKLPDVPGLTHAELTAAFANRAQLESSQRFSGISAHAARALFTEQAVSAQDLGSFLSQANAVVAASASMNTKPGNGPGNGPGNA